VQEVVARFLGSIQRVSAQIIACLDQLPPQAIAAPEVLYSALSAFPHESNAPTPAPAPTDLQPRLF